MANRIKPQSFEINDYISNDALDALYTLEGHYKGAETPKNYKGGTDKATTYYGMTEAGLNTIRKSGIDIPSWLKTASVSSITKEQARQAAGYLAVAHTKQLDGAYDDGETNRFSSLPLAWRSAILVLAHSNGVNGWINSYKEGNKGSLLRAIKSKDRELICRYMMAKKDGSIMDEPYGSEKSGRINRILASVKLMYDTTGKDFKTAADKDAAFKRWRENPNTVRNVQTHMYYIHNANLQNRDYMDNLRKAVGQDSLPAFSPDKELMDGKTVQANKAPEPEKPGIFANLTKPFKKLFTNSEEKENVAQGNNDINLQQSTSPAGRSPNQQLG